MKYALETRVQQKKTNVESKWDESKTKQMLEANGMKELRKIFGKTKIDRIRSQKLRESCGIQPINKWVENRRW